MKNKKLKNMYGMRERQFKRFFKDAVKSREGVPGEILVEFA